MTTANTTSVALDNYVFVNARIKQWSGAKALSFDKELGVSNKDSIFKGTKDICPSSILKPFNTIERALAIELDRLGVRFLSANIWAIPKKRFSEAEAVIESIQDRFDEALCNLEANYDVECENFFKGKENEDNLRASKLPLYQVRERFQFSSAKFQMAETSFNEGIDSSALFDSFTTSIARQARDIFSSWEERKHKAVLKEKSLNSLKMLRDKIKGFIALSPNAYALSEHMDKVLASFPSGTLEGEHVGNAYALLSLLKDESSLKSFGGILIDSMRAAKDPVLTDAEDVEPLAAPAAEPVHPPAVDEASTLIAETEPSVQSQELPEDDFVLPEDLTVINSAPTQISVAVAPLDQNVPLVPPASFGLAIPEKSSSDFQTGPAMTSMAFSQTPAAMIFNEDDIPFASSSEPAVSENSPGEFSSTDVPFVDEVGDGVPAKSPF